MTSRFPSTSCAKHRTKQKKKVLGWTSIVLCEWCVHCFWWATRCLYPGGPRREASSKQSRGQAVRKRDWLARLMPVWPGLGRTARLVASPAVRNKRPRTCSQRGWGEGAGGRSASGQVGEVMELLLGALPSLPTLVALWLLWRGARDAAAAPAACVLDAVVLAGLL